VARDRKRAKQRRERRAPRGAAARSPGTELHRADLPGALEHASSEVDEFDAALIRGAHGVPAPPDAAPQDPGAPGGAAREEREAIEAEARVAADIEPERALPELFLGGAHIERAPEGEDLVDEGESEGGGRGGRGNGGVALEPPSAGGGAEKAGRAVEHRERKRPLPARAVAFLRASWAELQRVQWPDRPQVSQATAVVLGFVAVAGLYLGAADWVAQKIVNFIL
jgi:preprotein translocase subunit SecE